MKIEKYKPLVDKVYRKLGISPINNVYVLLYLIDRTKNISGDIAEFGIYKGGTLACAALYLKEQGIDKKIYGFDSFKGFPKYSEYDLKKASFKILKYLENVNLDEDEVENIVSTYPLEAQVKFYKIGGANAITRK